MFRFSDPYYLILLVAVILLGYRHFFLQHGRGATLRFSHLGIIKRAAKHGSLVIRQMLFVLKLLALIFIVLAFARPQSGVKGEEVITEGVDIVLVMDISGSMLAEDIKPNRLEAAKEVAAEFVKGRKNDRIGMVVFAGEAYTQCPLTLDYGVLLNFLENIHVGMIEDGTAIGMGLATGVNRLRNSKAKSKVIVLLTDGRNNRGQIDPTTAAQLAQALDVKIHAIGAGTTQGTAPYPVDDPFFGKRYVPIQVDIDEPMLRKVAQITGGKMFRATDRNRLKSIYKEIDEMEKTEIKVKEYTRYSELFHYFLIIGLGLLLTEAVLANTRFRKIP
ncbi:VWA domain-containing protein [bacterium]|nr:VWA domain-containing protein [bacterium]